MTPAWRAGASLAALLTAAGCTADRIERGVFHSKKGYEVRVPGESWQVTSSSSEADLELKRATPPGGMLAAATCDERIAGREPERLVRHLTFGLKHRADVQTEPLTVGGRAGARSTLRGTLDGNEVSVEAVSVKDDRCVYDFLYVAPVDAFEAGRSDFRAFVESLAVSSGATR